MDFDKLKDDLQEYIKERYVTDDPSRIVGMELAKSISAVSTVLIVEALKLYHQQLGQE